MRNKLGVVMLAAVLTIAGTREAFQQFGELKSSVADWTQTSILGNLLVFTGGTIESSGAQPQTVLLAQSYTACKGERSRPATVQSVPASKMKAASAEHAKSEKSLAENSLDTRGLDGLAQSLAAARDTKSREQLIVKVIPQVSEIAKAWGTEFDAHEAEETTARTRTVVGEAGATRARVAAELKKLGLRRVYIRVAKIEGVKNEGSISEVQLPATFAPALKLKSHAGLPAATLREGASEFVPQGASLPVEQFDRDNFFYASHTSFDCDGDPLN